MRIDAVMLAYGKEQWLAEAVDAVLRSTGAEVSLTLVDNGSESVAGLAARPGLRVLTPTANLGYAGGCDLGAEEATAEFIAFVNSDAIVAPDALAKVAAVAAEPGVGAAMASIRHADRLDVVNTAGNPLHIAGLSWAGGNDEPASAYATRTSVPSLSGCAFVVRRDLWRELGGFAAEYFAYHEDTELSLRLWQRGLAPAYVPDAVVGHHYEFSRNEFKYYLLERNRLVTVLSAYAGRTILLLLPVLLLTEAAMLATAAMGGWFKAKVRGYGWLWRNRSWIRARHRQLQAERTVRDRALAHLFTARFAPSNVDTPPGMGVYNVLAGLWWRLIRPLL
ncbi:glycosyltransferase family 2 protein [Hamadaea tsunoensis]|uniref:glycosyltransferase family 2 protein n=1 Tax=Hamadaea tsunoensis TaxID=53368 RepID=UPI000425F4F7|nr:glycosyltransferase family 2 protein [Hamadaea tsunoensis]